MTFGKLAVVTLFSILAYIDAGSSNAPSVEKSQPFHESVLNCFVGGCEKGGELLANGNACEANASFCSVTTTKITVGTNLGVSVSIDLDVPTGCNSNTIYKPLCPGVVKYTVQGDGEVKKIKDTQCEIKKKQLCHAVRKKFCQTIGSVGTGHTANDIIQWIVNHMSGLTAAEVTYQDGQICIDSPLVKDCETYNPTDYSCGAIYSATVETCP